MMDFRGSRIIIALDYADPVQALDLASGLSPQYCRLKVGKELFTRAGPAVVDKLVSEGFDVFLDLKFHDIAHTVARACVAAADMGVWMLNVHALGGRKMMEAAREAIDRSSHHPRLIAVTVLTNLDGQDLREIGLPGTPYENVLRLAALAKKSGLDGVVCSPQEVEDVRQTQGAGFCLVTPGIRPRGAQLNDQRRVMTPADAIRHGADYLVVCRPITSAEDPLGALLAIQAEVDAALGGVSPHST